MSSVIFVKGSLKQPSISIGKDSSSGSQSAASCEGGHCSAVGSGRGIDCDRTGCDGCGSSSGSSMSVIQASTLRKKTNAGLGNNVDNCILTDFES